MLRAVLAIAALLLVAPPAGAQITGGVTPPPELVPAQRVQGQSAAPSGILVLNQERLLSRTQYGVRMQAELETAGLDLGAENRRIEAALMEEELALTSLRATLAPEDFRPLATEFDSRVEGIRTAQDAKARELTTQTEAAQQRFFEIAFPILLELVQERGAAVLLDSRSVLLSSDAVDITEDAIARIDAEIGDGGSAPLLQLQGEGGVAPLPRPDAPEVPAEGGAPTGD